MKNPGLTSFSEAMLLDPELDEDERESDYVRPEGFGRWKNPGQSIRVPVQQGPTYAPGQSPEDAIHGEVVTPEGEDAANRILSGEHESDQPSANPLVEGARKALQSVRSFTATHTVAGLLMGKDPDSFDPRDLNDAHTWLKQHFDRVTANPQQGKVVAQSQAGTQVMRRQPAPIETSKPAPRPSYTLTNRHGTFESDDPERLVHAMVAFGVVNNIEAQQNKKKKEHQQATSAAQPLVPPSWNARNPARPGPDARGVPDYSDVVEGDADSFDPSFTQQAEGGLPVEEWLLGQRTAARPKGGLGRGLGQITNPGASAKGMGLKEDGSTKEVDPDEPGEDRSHHPLADEEIPEGYEGYKAPRSLLGLFANREHAPKLNTTAAELDRIDEFMGKHGFQPGMRPNDEQQLWLAPIPGQKSAYFRLTQGVPHPKTGERGWVLTADTIPRDRWLSDDGSVSRSKNIPVPGYYPQGDPGDEKRRYRRQPLPAQGDYSMGEKTFLAGGSHPVKDPILAHAIADVGKHGRNSATYQNAFMDTAYEPPRLPVDGTQRQMSLYSATNPGLSRFTT